jgi:hypothetical protein
MRRVPFLLGSAATAVVALVLPGAASAQTVTPVGAATAVREYAGTIVFSQFDQASSRWYLAVRRADATTIERLPVASSATPFDADIGPDSGGRPALIYQRCSGTTAEPTGCDLFVFSLAGGGGERPVRSANNPEKNDVEPTLWRGRIAWTREYGSRKHASPVVYTRKLTGPPSRRSTRLPGVPQRRCGDVDPGCGPTTNRSVQALELRGDKLALTVRYGCRTCSGILQSELRLDDLGNRTSRQVAFQVIGLSGQSLVGPSFFAGRLAWYRACLGDPGGCKGGGVPFRYRLSTHRYEKGAPGPVRLDGFADTGALLYEVVGCSEETQAPLNPNCRIDETAPPRYAATRRPRR